MRGRRTGDRSFAAAAALAMLLWAFPAQAETISPDSWVYDALRSFEVRGLVRLEPTLPYTFDECERYVREISDAVERNRVTLGPRHRFLLDRLTRQFIGMAEDPEGRYDPPVAVIRDGGRWAAFDATVGAAFVKIGEDKGEAYGLATPGLLVDLGRRLTLETEYRLVMGPERGNRANDRKPSARTRSYRGLTGEFTRGLAAMNGEWWDVRVGREYLQWGSSRKDALTVSRFAGSFDHFGGGFDLGRFTLSTIQASLDPFYQRHLAGHRLTVELPRGIFLGLGETVVYCRRDFDWKYLTPVGFFYAHQYSEGILNEDNVVWSFDWKLPVVRNFLLYGELLIDDIQYERGGEAGPDKLGIDVAAEGLLMIAGRELELELGYARIDAYTYGHWNACADYMTGTRSSSFGPLIGGSTLGPDADRLFGSATLGVSGRLVAGLQGIYERFGGLSTRYGQAPPDWRPALDPDPPFPSPPVTTEKIIAGTLSLDFGGGSYVSLEAGVDWWRVGEESDGRYGYCRIEVALDLQ